MPKTKQHVEKTIRTTFCDYPVAQALSSKCLADTASFVTQLVSFISESYDYLFLSGFQKQDTWHLVTQLVDRMFSVELDLYCASVCE